jgi:Insertion element 4 transposase N-terminal
MLYSLRHIAPQSKFAHALHLDIFEHLIPPTLIGDVLTETQGWEEREKTLNMPMVIAIVIAMGLFASCSIPHVLHKLACGLRYIWPDPRLRLPGASAISQRRKPLGVTPLRRLFERVCQPRATQETPGAFAFGLRLMAIDSMVEKVADTFANVLTFGSPSPRVAQRDEEEGKDGLSCGLKRLCLVDQNRSDEAHRAARKQERFQSERVQNG